MSDLVRIAIGEHRVRLPIVYDVYCLQTGRADIISFMGLSEHPTHSIHTPTSVDPGNYPDAPTEGIRSTLCFAESIPKGSNLKLNRAPPHGYCRYKCPSQEERSSMYTLV